MPNAGCVAVAAPICSGVSGLGSSIFGAGATAALDSLSTWVAKGSVWFLGQIGSAMSATTTVDLSSPWFLDRSRVIEELLGIVALPFLLLTAISAILRQDLGVLGRAVLVQLPLGMVLAGGAAELTAMALSATDGLCRAVSVGTGGAVASMASAMSSSLSATAGGAAVPAFVLLLLAAVVAGAGVLLWIELVLRAGAIYAAVAFLPLVLVAGVWPAAASWSRRLVETLAALVTSKLVVVLVLALGAGALGTANGRGLPALMTGTGMLLLAGFAPFSLLKLLPMFEASAAGHLEGMRQRGTRAIASGPPRQLVEMALTGAAGPASVAPTVFAAKNRVGSTLAEDPMATAARFGGEHPRPSAPTRPAGSSEDSTTRAAEPSDGPASNRRSVRWPGAPEHPGTPGVDSEAPGPRPAASPPTTELRPSDVPESVQWPEAPVRPTGNQRDATNPSTPLVARPRSLQIVHDELGPRIVPAGEDHGG